MTGLQARGDFLPLRLSLVVLSVALGSPLAFSQSTAPNPGNPSTLEDFKAGDANAKRESYQRAADVLKALDVSKQSNGKIERWHKSLKGECIRPGTPLSLDDARRLVQGYVERYNNVRLNSATGYITPKDMLAGKQQEIHGERDRKLKQARKQRQIRRQQAA